MTNVAPDLERVQQALGEGRTTVKDEEGRVKYMYARCPSDGLGSPVYTTTSARGAGVQITSVRFKCPACGGIFEASPPQIYLM